MNDIFISNEEALKGTFYLDSVNGRDENDGMSPEAPWKTLDRVASVVLSPGSKLLLKRGCVFKGMLEPKGSGAPGYPISIGAYGTGPRPLIDGGEDHEAAVRLFNQEYWEIRDIETTGGSCRGIYIGANEPGRVFHCFRIINCTAHDVYGESTLLEEKNTGLIIVSVVQNSGAQFEDVVIDGCTAWSTKRWSGIMIFGSNTDDTRSRNVYIRNCTVHDVYGDGIIIFCGENGAIESCVAYDTGNDPHLDVGTPNSIWQWCCNKVDVRFCEAYNSHSPAVDGGAFDIDFWNNDCTVEYCYAHDCDSYGIAVFGAGGKESFEKGTTRNTVIRYNIFSNNGRTALGAKRGDFNIATWDNGSIDGLKIYNNTSYWNPVVEAPAYNDFNENDGGALKTVYTGCLPRFFKNNIIYSTCPQLIDCVGTVEFDHNLYWHTGDAKPKWRYEGRTYDDLGDFGKAEGQELHGIYADPCLNKPDYSGVGMPKEQFTPQKGSPAIKAGTDVGDMGTRDFLGNRLHAGAPIDIGACQSSPVTDK